MFASPRIVATALKRDGNDPPAWQSMVEYGAASSCWTAGALMELSYRQIAVERYGDVFCVRLRRRRMDENQIYELAEELTRLIDEEGCRKMAFSLGPGQMECLYSVFLAKLATLRCQLAERQGRLKICEATADTIAVFEACHLKQFFDFVPDLATAVGELEA
jgi:hypothetical protein